MSNNKKQLNQSSESLDLYVAKLTFLGASIATLGDGLQAVAAGIALEALEKEKSNNKSSQSNNGNSKQIEVMQEQIDYLINELHKVKKMFKW